MIFHHKYHTTYFELALRFYLFASNKVKCDENDRLESLFRINAKQWWNSYEASSPCRASPACDKQLRLQPPTPAKYALPAVYPILSFFNSFIF